MPTSAPALLTSPPILTTPPDVTRSLSCTVGVPVVAAELENSRFPSTNLNIAPSLALLVLNTLKVPPVSK